MHEVAKPLVLLLELEVMGLVSDQRQVVVVVVRVFHAELAVRVHVAVDHLWVVVISLRLDLVVHALLENIGRLARLVLLYRGHHVGAGGEVRVVAGFEGFELVLPRGHDGLVRVRGAHVVVLEPLGAGDSVRAGAHLLAGHVGAADHAKLLLAGHELWVLLIALGEHLLLIASIVHHILLARVERYLNPAVGVPYCF